MFYISYQPITNQPGFAYTYKITNLITNQFYFGSRYSKKIIPHITPKEDFWVKYFSSSKEVKQLISIYGINSFQSEIIFTSKNWEEVYRFEQDLIKINKNDCLLLNKKFFNLSENKLSHINFTHKKESIEKQKISKIKKYNIGFTSLSEVEICVHFLFFNLNMSTTQISKFLGFKINNYIQLSEEEIIINQKRISSNKSLQISKSQKQRIFSESEKIKSSERQILKNIKNYEFTTLENFKIFIRDLFFNYNMTALDIANYLNLCKSTIHNHLTRHLSKEEKAWNRKRIHQMGINTRLSLK